MSENQRMVEDLSVLSPLKNDKSGEDEGILDMSDEDLYTKLKEYDSNIGPITRSTRKVYARKLNKYLNSGLPTSTSPATINLLGYSDDEGSNGVINVGGAGDIIKSSTQIFTTESKTKSSKVFSQNETKTKSTRSSSRYHVRGDAVENDYEEDDGGWVESGDDDEDNRASGIFRSYPTSFSHFSANTSSRADEFAALVKSANETFSSSQRLANDSLGSSFRFNFADKSTDDVVSYMPQGFNNLEKIQGLMQSKYKKSNKLVKSVRKEVGGSWCECFLKLLALVVLVAVVVLCVVVYQSMDKDYKIDIRTEEWVKWGRESIGGCVKWVKALGVVRWVKAFVNEWVVWVKEFELMA